MFWEKTKLTTSYYVDKCNYPHHALDENNYSHTKWWMKVTIRTKCVYVVDESHYSHTTFDYLMCAKIAIHTLGVVLIL